MKLRFTYPNCLFPGGFTVTFIHSHHSLFSSHFLKWQPFSLLPTFSFFPSISILSNKDCLAESFSSHQLLLGHRLMRTPDVVSHVRWNLLSVPFKGLNYKSNSKSSKSQSSRVKLSHLSIVSKSIHFATIPSYFVTYLSSMIPSTL